MKTTILDALGERGLLLPSRIGVALRANDRAKYLLSLLQSARAHADAPDIEPATSLRAERVACGVDDPGLDDVPLTSRRFPGSDLYCIPSARELSRLALAAVREMLDPLEDDAAREDLDSRLASLVDQLDDLEDDRVTSRHLAVLTSADARAHDSLHLLVMDAHKALNRLQAALATESIDGARAYAIEPSDRPLIQAFMRGVGRTGHLRFDHPGLTTTATRVGDTLVLQNDIGMTDAHVIVVRVRGLTATTTYTDVHLGRLLFFEQMLEARGARWEDTRSRRHAAVEGGVYHMGVGTLNAGSPGELERFLEDLGSRLVFLIDWNRARKRLRRLVGNRDAIALLTWAAAEDLGHMAFLKLGGEALVYGALDRVARGSVRAGETLREMIGAQAALEYLRAVLGLCAVGLLERRPASLIADEVAAELLSVMRRAQSDELAPAGQHAELIVEIAGAVRDALLRGHLAEASARRADAAVRAKHWESRADAVLNEVRAAARRSGQGSACLDLLTLADDVADDLEEAAFHLNLLPEAPLESEVERALQSLSALVLHAVRQYLIAIETARHLAPGSSVEEVEDFLAAVHRVLTLEHESDAAERRVSEAAVGAFDDARRLFVVAEAAGDLERAADGLLRAALALREHVMGAVLQGAGTAELTIRPAPLPREQSPGAPALPGEPPVFTIVAGSADGDGDALSMGAKAYGLARLARAGLPVPDAIVLGTAWSRDYLSTGSLPDGFRARLATWLRPLEAAAGLTLGGERRPLLLAVRSGAPVSMPGMLDTILNVGLNEASARGLVRLTGNPRLVWSSYWRLVRSFAETVHGCSPEPFEALVRERLGGVDRAELRDLDAADLAGLTRSALELFAQLVGRPFPEDPMEQLELAVEAVFRSAASERARAYARLQQLPDSLGTGVTVQRMVFGNAGGASGAGVGFTRDPATGENRLYLDFLFDAQGEDVVSGRYRIPEEDELGRITPAVLQEINAMRHTLETEFHDAQEFEFTVEDGRLFLLQTRTAKRTPQAALRIAIDQVREGAIRPDAALERLAGIDLEALRVVRVVGTTPGSQLGIATPASVGVARGEIAVDAVHAQEVAAAGRPAILVREDISTEDVAGLAASAGVLTAAGGRTSHAAVVARELGKVCLVGCPRLRVDVARRRCFIGDRELVEGEALCLDGNSGAVFAGEVRVSVEAPTAELAEIARWRADASRPGPSIAASSGGGI